MQVLPISNMGCNSGYKSSFKAVDPKYLKLAKDEFKLMNTISGDLIERLQLDIISKKISKEDGIDTVKALYPYAKTKYHILLDSMLSMYYLK